MPHERRCQDSFVPFRNTSGRDAVSRRWLKNHFICQRPGGLLDARLMTGIKGVLITALLSLSSVPAGAGTEVAGQLDSLQLRAEHASPQEALAALAASFKLTYKLPPNISRDLNGLYSGDLRRVLARILDGTDYFVKTADDRIEVVVLQASGTFAAPAVSNHAGSANQAASSPLPPLASYLTKN
jgi:hypothetical protein